jgi:chemotaxis protein methyltransferase CheR
LNRSISPAEVAFVAQYVYEISGIVIESDKAYLVENRLRPVLGRWGASNYIELIRQARSEPRPLLQDQIIDAITTNETSFFRDERPFLLLAHKLLPDHFERQAKKSQGARLRLDVWSAASSTGQEVYSIAMVAKELLHDLGRYWIKIIGTDISESTLDVASRGRYTTFELSRGLSEKRQKQFFVQQGNLWQIADELRSLVTFKPQNLLRPLGHLGLFDMIFCRNVAIYFSQENRRVLFDRLADQLKPQGVLIIGATESLLGVSERFERQQFHGSTYYEKIG